MSFEKHDTALHIAAGGFGLVAEGCPACAQWRLRDGDMQLMRRLVRTRNHEGLGSLLLAAVMQGAPQQDVTDTLVHLINEADPETQQWWANHPAIGASSDD